MEESVDVNNHLQKIEKLLYVPIKIFGLIKKKTKTHHVVDPNLIFSKKLFLAETFTVNDRISPHSRITPPPPPPKKPPPPKPILKNKPLGAYSIFQI